MSEETGGTKHEAARLRKLVSKKRYDDLDAAWSEAIESGSIEPADLISVLEKIAHEDDVERAEALLWVLLSERAERNGPADALELGKLAADAFPQSDTLREELASLYPAAHADADALPAFVELTVARKDLALPDAAKRIEQFLALRPGTYVLDPERDEPARVAAFDPDTKTFEVESEGGPRTYDADAALALTPLGEGDFRALMVFDPSQLESLAHENPAELITKTLRAFGPKMTFKTMKARLAGIISAKAWGKWWTQAKPLLRAAAWVDMGDGSQPAFALHKTPIPYDAILKASFNAAQSSEEKLVCVLDYLAEIAGGAEPHEDTLRFFGTQLGRLADERRQSEPAAAIAALALMLEIHKRVPQAVPPPDHALEASLFEGCDFAGLLRPVRGDTLARLVLDLVRDALPEQWPDALAAAMPGGSHTVCAWIAQRLRDAGRAELLRKPADAILSRSDRDIGALVWLWKSVCSGGLGEAVGERDAVTVTAALLSAADQLGRAVAREKSDEGSKLNAVRNALTGDGCAMFRSAVEHAETGRARMIRSLIERNRAFTDMARKRLMDTMRRAHRELFVEHVPPWQEDVVYTTEAGLEKHKSELSHLVRVKMAAASAAVGKAAEMGDLSENAEWTAAKEERDRIATRASMMQEELNKARVLTPTMAQSESVTIGSAVKAKDLESGEIEEMTFLGPWDVDPENRVYSYRAKLGLVFMGKKPGEKVIFGAEGVQRSWEVLEVRSAL